ncbi:MAG: hypothetical protein ACYYK0_01140 [Candidatus Eutrophobiaceae bacterium]
MSQCSGLGAALSTVGAALPSLCYDAEAWPRDALRKSPRLARKRVAAFLVSEGKAGLSGDSLQNTLS